MIIKKINAGVIGCGAIADTHLKALQSINGCHILLVCDKNQARVNETAARYGAGATTDFNQLLTDKQIAVVHILTPHHLHVPMTISALKNHKHVVLEKPAGINIQELKELLQVYQRHDRKVSLCFQNRFNNTSRQAKRLIESGQLGRFIAAKCIVTWNRKRAYYANSDWKGRLNKEGGGVLINQAIHSLDLVRWLCGDIIGCQGHINNFCHDYIETEDVAVATLFHKNGGVSSLYCTNNHGTDSAVELELVFENSILRLDRNRLYRLEDEKLTEITRDAVASGGKKYWGSSHLMYLQEFYTSLQLNKNVPVPLEDGIKTNEIVLKLYEANKQNRKLAIDSLVRGF